MIIVQLVGGFCNNLFQYAAARNLAHRFDDELKLDVEFFRNPSLKDVYRLNYLKIQERIASPEEINKLANVKPKSITQKLERKIGIPSVYNKKTHFIEKMGGLTSDKRFFNLKPDIYLEGWFSDEDYFKNIRDILLKEFELKNELRPESKEVLNDILGTNAVSIHFRRGAFLQNEKFGVLPLDYYYRAIDYITTKVKEPCFYIFSDDIEWVQNHFKTEANVTFISHNSYKPSIHNTQYDYEDLFLMKNCKHNIMAYSTFSWWGAWLNQNPGKIVIAPMKAVRDTKLQKDYERNNFIPKDWIKL
jgi:hypothetical protein